MHTIRLRGAWETGEAAGRTTHARKFGRPRTLDPGERLWLVCAHVPGPAEVSVNGMVIGSVPLAGPFAIDITDHLQPRNAVVFAVSSAEPLGEVILEVRTTGD